VTPFSASSIAFTPASSAALSAALLLTTGEPPEKSMVLPSCMGTGGAAAGRLPGRCDTYAHRTAAVAAAATSAEAVRRVFTRHTIVHRAPVRNNARS